MGLLLVLLVELPDGEDALVMVLEGRTAVGRLLLGLPRVVLLVRQLVGVPRPGGLQLGHVVGDGRDGRVDSVGGHLLLGAGGTEGAGGGYLAFQEGPCLDHGGGGKNAGRWRERS